MHDFAFFLDFDDTLIDAGALKGAMREFTIDRLGDGGAEAFWRVYEEIRDETGVVDMPETVRRSTGAGEGARDELAHALLAWDPRPFVHPAAFDAVAHLASLGLTAIVSDGDPVYQAAKIRRSGLAAAVEGRVHVCAHKEQHFAALAALYRARRYVVIDDKARILAAARAALPGRVTTIRSHGGAPDAGFAADITVADAGALLALGAADFRRDAPAATQLP